MSIPTVDRILVALKAIVGRNLTPTVARISVVLESYIANYDT